MTLRTLAAVTLLSVASAAHAAPPFPTRYGESGLLDVPDAEMLGAGVSAFTGELRLDHAPGMPDQLGPFPLAFGTGMGRWDLGVSMREGGRPGDPRPSALLFGAALKRSIIPPGFGLVPVAAELTLDRANRSPVGSARLVTSLGGSGAVRLAAYAGWEAFGAVGPAAGAAVAFPLPRDLEAVAQATAGPRGGLLGGAIRWAVTERLGASLGFDWLTREQGFRVSLAFSVRAVPERHLIFVPAALKEKKEEEEPEEQKVAFLDDRPHFRLRIGVRALHLGAPGHEQFAPYSGPAVAVASVPRPQAPAAGSAPSAEDLLEGQLREQEGQADARARRLRATEDGLAARESAADAAAKRLDARERELADREQQLDDRERQLHVRGAMPAAERQLESTEAQLGASERQLQAQARGFDPAIDAAAGRERDAAQRARGEGAEADRLAGAAPSAPSRAEQLDVRRQALAARHRQLAAEEARLVAKGERLDARERQLRAREAALDAWQRRLDAKAERLDLAAARAAAARRAAEVAAARPAPEATGAAPAKDRSVFVMVVKSPTAILKDSAQKAQAPADAGAAAPFHAGVAVEKAVAAATVLYFPTPAAQISELDREGLQNIARVAAQDGCEVLVWARAKDPSLMPEATRRSSEIKALVMKLAPVQEKQIVTRITTRPGAQGVDVVVSALRGQQGGGGAEAAPAAAPAPAAALGTGETAKRQLREAVQANQRDIERCIGLELVMRKLDSAEVLLKLTVDAAGKVTRASVDEGPLAGEEVRACLGAAAKRWAFPQTGAEYAVDVPITVVAPGKKP